MHERGLRRKMRGPSSTMDTRLRMRVGTRGMGVAP